jgi:orotidine-5'-phosphate decarboxylase
MNFLQKLDAAASKNDSLLCVGLDPDLDKIPEEFKTKEKPLFEFCKYIIHETHDSVCAYKPNSAFFEAFGADGIKQLKDTCDYIKKNFPNIPIILDAKRGDIGNTNLGYTKFAFDYLGCDAITLSPYMGEKSLEPFLDRTDKGCIILCQTSNDGAAEFQSLQANGEELYKAVARAVAEKWNKNGNCLLVTGATYPEELKDIRQITGEDMVFLVPGIGAQGGDLEAILKAGLNGEGKGLVINSSRGIIYSDSPSKAAKELKNQINQSR